MGLAAGFDKSGATIDDIAHLGFGFIEVGTVTPRPQPGNPPPNLFRLVPDTRSSIAWASTTTASTPRSDGSTSAVIAGVRREYRQEFRHAARTAPRAIISPACARSTPPRTT
jgi:hypothetical protein